MTLEEKRKELLLQDLCCRLPYGVKIKIRSNDIRTVKSVNIANGVVSFLETDTISPFGLHIENPLTFKQQVKPYLRPLSAITEEEMERLTDTHSLLSANGIPNNVCCTVEGMDYLNSIHVDYRGLIPMGLALEAPEDMYKIE